jgi:hypothetical protein
MSVVLIVLGALLLVAIVLGLWVAGVYNALVTLRNRFKNAFAQIDVQLKRRYDLIPNLVEVAKGYMKHESGTLEAVIQARNTAYAASKAAAANPADAAAMKGLLSAESGLGGALSRLMVVSEQYPDLKANQNMMQLTEETHLHGEQDLLRPAGLQRLRHDLQHPPRVLPDQPPRRPVQLRRGATLPDRKRRRTRRPAGEVHLNKVASIG